MTELWGSRWWVLIVRGVFGLTFGILALGWPGIDTDIAAALFGAYVISDGLATLLVAATRGALPDRWTLALEGAMGVIAGVVALVWPSITDRSLLVIVATWAVATGAWELVEAVRLRREIEHEWLLALGGMASVLAGLALAARSTADVIALTLLIGFYALTFGCLLITLGLRMRDVARSSTLVDLVEDPHHEPDHHEPPVLSGRSEQVARDTT